MNRQELLDMICPSEKECIRDGTYSCQECDEVLNEWLDEYNNTLKADICREFAHNIKERFNASIPPYMPSRKAYFSLGQARKFVDMTLAEMRKK